MSYLAVLSLINLVEILTRSRQQKVNIHFYPILPDFRNRIALSKVPKLRPFVLLVRVKLRWCVRSVGALIMTGEKPKYFDKNKPLPVPLCSLQVPHGLTWDGIRASAVTGRRMTS
jgi:hypothetical protein